MILYRDNQLDQAFEAEPKDVAQQFVDAVRGGYDLSRCRPSMEFAFRWWLSGGEGGLGVTWDDEDTDALLDGLLTIPEADREFIWSKLMEDRRG